MKISADEIASVIQQEITNFESEIDVREVGTVLEVGDGIARVHGLTNVAAGEMVEFPGGIIGLAFNLEENSVGIIILGDYLKINEGDQVKSLGTLLSVPVGDAVVGRVVDPLGNPLDGKGRFGFNRFKGLFRHTAEAAVGFGGCNFHVEPTLKFGLLTPDGSHLGEGVALDHRLARPYEFMNLWGGGCRPPAFLCGI